MGFQQIVYDEPAAAVEGDFASSNPRFVALAGPEGFVSGGNAGGGTSGCVVGRFAWANAAGVVTNGGTGAPTGFVHREQQAVITAWLNESTMVIPAGLPVTVYSGGDFWAKTETVATVGQKVFASNTTGAIKTGAAGATVSGHTETRWVVCTAGAANSLIKISSNTQG
ncbi:structural cement protein Gp24 [Bordetella sp. 02P26C-1]|uniref:structural cement protein Gp24 n=1 Tax=Bordetella sp. 02P26C-1 TaxID=2683195 RepID=UPI001354F846|nr:hypothetical protein [Bordetella sp. 02P26C-1]MVW80184.1 hypothetical protein [Bordetella sp. 02P26C-1]